MGTRPTPQQQEAAQHVARLLRGAQALAKDHGTAPTLRGRAESTRHILQVIKRHRLYPDTTSENPQLLTISLEGASPHNYVAKAFKGDLPRVKDAAWVLAVATACYQIADIDFGDEQKRELLQAVKAVTDADADTVAVAEVDEDPPVPDPKLRNWWPGRRFLTMTAGALVAVAAATAWFTSSDEADGKNPQTVSKNRILSCLDGTKKGEIIREPAKVFTDDQATMITPTLDFDIMNGSARYLSHKGPKYYWGRAGSDDNDPHSGGIRLRWTDNGGDDWHECRTPLPVDQRDYVRTPAVPTVIGGRDVTVKICLWRDEPYTEKCTVELG